MYFISGLGADKSAFSRIHLKNVSVAHVEWVKHNPSDSLDDYVQKLLDQIDTERPFVLVGLSFGGIIAQEMNRFVFPEKTILISSITHHCQFPWFYQMGKVLVPLLSDRFFTKSNALVNYLFGAKGKNIQVLNRIMEANDPQFVKWCVQQLLRWKKKEDRATIITIHGTNDKIIPFHSCDYTIQNGSHFMVYSKANEIEHILQKEIDCVR